MAETHQYGVLFQVTLGLPSRQASQEEREKAAEAQRSIAAKWKEEGIETLAVITTQATEHAHTMIFRLKNADQFQQMSQDINNARDCFKLVEKFSIALGWFPLE